MQGLVVIARLLKAARGALLIAAGILGSAQVIAQTMSISRNGEYVFWEQGSTLVVSAPQTSWRRTIEGAHGATFSADGARVLFSRENGALCWVSRRQEREACTLPVDSFKQPQIGSSAWLAYQLRTPDHPLILANPSTGKEERFEFVTDYLFEDHGASMVVKSERPVGAGKTVTLQWIDLRGGTSRTIWSSEPSSTQAETLGNYRFDKSGKQLVFSIRKEHDDIASNVIMYYHSGMSQSRVIVSNASPGIERDLRLAPGPADFSPNGTRIFFDLVEKDGPPPDPKITKLDVWSYKDARLQSQQLKDLGPRRFLAVVEVSSDGHIVRLQGQNEVVLSSSSGSGRQLNDDYALVCQFAGDVIDYDVADDFSHFPVTTDADPEYTMQEYNWNKALWNSVYLVSTRDGSRRLLKDRGPSLTSKFPYYWLSPESRYVVYYDEKQEGYFSYEIASGRRRAISANLAVRFARGDDQGALAFFRTPRGIAAWQGDDAAVFVYDQFTDVWRLDLAGHRQPQSITLGDARKHHLSFSIERSPETRSDPPVFHRADERVLLDVWSEDAHRQTLYEETKANARVEPRVRVTLGPCGGSLLKASDKDAYLLTRIECGRGRQFSYFYGTELGDLTPLTGIREETEKGVTAEVIRWHSFDGSDLFGLLYKPEDFDATKKYPVLIDYYEKDASIFAGGGAFSGLDGEFNPLARGYLWFITDIHYVRGETGPSAYNSVVSGAQEIAKLPFVDAKRMGIYGESFGGYETNYIVTHTTMFAAASSGSGLSDLISLYGSYDRDKQGFSTAAQFEVGQFRIGATPWERMDLYIKNSPIFDADKVTTPILLMANDHDLRVPVTQGIEFFKALRRLGKKAWLLQYDEGGHHASPVDDWERRKAQFFDYYLKGSAPPKWMTEGIPARLKGIEDGLQLDISGAVP